MSRFEPCCCPTCLDNRFDWDPDVDWVGRVLHERWLADRDTRAMRELTPAERRARLNLKFAQARDQARTRGTQQLSNEC
jgi:hypothetical protein